MHVSMRRMAAAVMLAGVTLGSGSVQSADYTTNPSEFLDMMVRLRAISVIPDEGATVYNGAAPFTAAQAGVKISSSVVPEIDITYFFNENWALELICCVTPHKVYGTGTVLGPLGQLGSTTLFPPTVLLQRHFMLSDRIKPYVGAGVNYTVFFNEKPGAGALALGATDIDFKDSFGVALQAGVDIALNERMYLNFDVKKLFLDTKVTFVGSPFTADVDIDPWIIGVGVGYRFSSNALFGGWVLDLLTHSVVAPV